MEIIFLAGAINIIFGISAIVCNWYPNKDNNIQKIKLKNPKADEKKIVTLEGVFFLVSGAICIILGILLILNVINDTILMWLIFSFIVLLAVTYYPIRNKYLS